MDVCSQLNLEAWDLLSPEDRLEIASEVCRRLPEFRLEGMALCIQAEQRHPIAFFLLGGHRFALIAGSEATLGFDPENPWVPSEVESENWDRFRYERGRNLPPLPDLDVFVSSHLSKLRRVRIRPFLLEVASVPLDEKPLSPDDPIYDHELVLRLTAGFGGATQFRAGRRVTYTLDERSVPQVIEDIPVRHGDAVSYALSSSLRLPTSDEWEYACAAGSRSLFRWGDRVPLIPEHPMPDSLAGRSPAELHRNPALLSEYLDYSNRDPMMDPSCNPSLLPNAFGLTLPPVYSGRPEYCHETDCLKGAGSTALLEMPDMISAWLPTASAFIYQPAVDLTKFRLSRAAVRRAVSLQNPRQ